MSKEEKEEKFSSDMVFVYGTLMRGGYLHHIMEEQGAKFIGPAITKKSSYFMYTPNEKFPTLSAGKYRIKGEIYKVTPDIIRYLDLVEGRPDFYERAMFKIRNHPGLAYVYIAGDKLLKLHHKEESPSIRTNERDRTQEWINGQ